MSRHALIAFVVVLSMTSVAPAATIFNRLGPGDTFSTQYGRAISWSTVGDEYEYHQRQQFTVPGNIDYVLDRIELPLKSQWQFVGRTFDLFVRPDAGGVPSDMILESFVITVPRSEAPILHVIDSLVRPTLVAGQQYWLHAAPQRSTIVDWMNSKGLGIPEDLSGAAYRVSGTPVPEPSTLFLAVVAAPAMVVTYRHCYKRRR